MWQVIVLLCALNGPCDVDNNIQKIVVPEPSPSLAQCGMVGQAYIANTTFAPRPGEERIKILCSSGPRAKDNIG